MMLIDSNIVFSLLLKQNDYKKTEKFFDAIHHLELKVQILDFALYSATLIFTRRGYHKEIKNFLQILGSHKNISIHRLKPEEILESLSRKVNLDFDDKLHYYLAKKKNLTFISYDEDFDKTDLKRLTPAQALEHLKLS